MKVLHIIPTLSPMYGGPSMAVFGMSTALVRHGIDITIATTQSFTGTDIDEVIIHEFPRRFESMLPSDFSYSPMLKKWLKLNAKTFDLLHIHTLFTYTTNQACHIARSLDIPYILRPCGMLSPLCLQKSRLKKAVWMNLHEVRNLKGAAAIQFTSEDEKKATEFFRVQVPSVVIPNGPVEKYDEEIGRHNSLNEHFQSFPERKKILFLSRLNPIKGLDLLIPALGLLADKRDDFVFVLAGSGESKDENEIRRLLSQNNLTRCTVKTGFVQGIEKYSLLSLSDVFVLPSYHENFGLAVTEAMAAGLPVVISDRVNIHHDVQAYNAGLVTTCDVQQMAGAIEKLLDDAALRKRMGENGKRLVREKFNWDVIVPKIISLYEHVLSGKQMETMA